MRTLSTAEAAELLGVSPRHVAKPIRRGVLPGYPVMTSGGRVLPSLDQQPEFAQLRADLEWMSEEETAELIGHVQSRIINRRRGATA